MGKQKSSKITRHAFMKKVGRGAAALGAAAMVPTIATPARGAARDYILIGRPNPSTGPIASFEEGTPWIDDRALSEINKDGGIYILDSIVGHIRYGEKNYARTPLVAGQWVKGERFPWDLKICYHGKHKNIATQARLIPLRYP